EHRLWLVVLLKLLAPPLVALPLLAAPALPVAGGGRRAANKDELVAPVAEAPADDVSDEDDLPAAVVQTPAPAPPVVPPSPVTHHPPPATRPWRWQHGLAAVWVTGALLWWGLAGLRVWRVGAVLGAARPPAPPGGGRGRW